MKKICGITWSLFLISTLSFGQYGHKIIYHTGTLGEDTESILRFQPDPFTLIFNDTLSFYHLAQATVRKSIGKELIHHGVMYNLNKKALFEMVNFKGKYLIENDRVFNWTLLKERKMILGYKCYAAIAINEKGDTAKAWYAPEIDKPFGPSGYNALPGMILEVQDQRYNGHILAVRIEKTKHVLMFPKHPIISAAEFRKRRAKR